MLLVGTQILRNTNTNVKLFTSGTWETGIWRAGGNGEGTREKISVINALDARIKYGWRLSKKSGMGSLTVTQVSIPLIAKEQYVLSVYARKISGMPLLTLQYGGNTSEGLELTSEWKRYTFSLKTETTGNVHVGIHTGATGTIEICGEKLEVGNSVTEWKLSDWDSVVATEIQDGIMSAADKAKLDGVAIGATVNMPSTTVPKVAESANVGMELGYSRGDHVHPSQTTISGNAGTATKLQMARTINGTSFDGTLNIVTSNWGTARNIGISDSDGTNTGTAVSVNGSGNITLRMPTIIKAALTGNATTASRLVTAKTIAISGGATGTATSFDGSDNINIPITALDVSKVTAGTLPLARGGTGATTAVTARTNLGVPPTNHASETNTYGVGSASNYGHVMSSSTTPQMSGTANAGIDNGKYAREGHIHPSQTSVSGNAGSATKLATARAIAISGGATGSATSFDGSSNVTIPVTSLDVSKATAGTLSLERGGTGATDSTSARTSLGVPPISHASTTNAYGIGSANDYGHVMASSTLPQMSGTANAGIDNGKYAREGHIHPSQTSISGNAGTATKLQTARIINGTSFDGTLNIVTSNWGTARNIDISDDDGTNTGATVSVNGSGNITLRMPTIIKAELTGNATTASRLITAKTIAISGGATGTATSFDGSDNISIPITALDVSKATAGTLPLARGGTGATTAVTARTNLGVPPTSHASETNTYGVGSASNYGHVMASSTLPQMSGTANAGIDNGKYACEGHVHPSQTSVSGNAGTATKLQAARTINGTSFDGTLNIVTSNWGTARNIGISDGDGTNTSAVVSVNGSGNITLKMPTTIKAALTGNATTASRLITARTIAISGGATGTATSFDGSGNISIPITALDVSKATAGTLPLARGGTGATTAAAARTNLGIPPTSHASTTNMYGVGSASNYGHAMASSATPLMAGTANVGSDNGKYAREGHVHPIQTSVSGNAGTATKLATARKINGVIFDGSKDIEIGLEDVPIKMQPTGNALNMNGYRISCYRRGKEIICNGYINSKAVINNATLITRLPIALEEVDFPANAVGYAGKGRIAAGGNSAVFNLPRAGEDYSFNFSYITSDK